MEARQITRRLHNKLRGALVAAYSDEYLNGIQLLEDADKLFALPLPKAMQP